MALVDTTDVGGPNEQKTLTHENKPLNPATIQPQIQALTSELLTLTTSKQGPKTKPSTRALSNDSTKKASRAS